jgi:hypothetical protein
VNVGVVCPGTPRLLAMGTDWSPGRAAAVYNGITVAKYGDQSNFVPFIVETGGRINAAGLEFFDTVSGAPLYGVADALVRQHTCICWRRSSRRSMRPISRWGAVGDVGDAA